MLKEQMKKCIVSLLLVPCMAMSMCNTVFAAPAKETENTVEKTNNGKKLGQNKGNVSAKADPEAPADIDKDSMVTIDKKNVKEGVPLPVSTTYPEGSILTYSWKVNGVEVSTEETYTPTKDDREKWIEVTVSCQGYEDQTAKIYFSNIPVIYLNFDVDYVIATKSNYVDAKIKMQGNEKFDSNTNKDDSVFYEKALKVKGRGNTSWVEDKKPFKLKLDKKANMLDMGKNKHWVLLADATEDSLMRNDLSYKLSGQFGLTYQDGEWVDLIVNGEYYGNYYLCEHVRIGSTRVDVEDVADAAEEIAAAICAAGKVDSALEDDLAGELEEDLSWVNSDTFTFEKNKIENISKYYKASAAADIAEKAYKKGIVTDEDALAEALSKDITWVDTNTFTFEERTLTISEYVNLNDYDTLAFNTGGVLFELDAYFDEISRFKTSLGQPIMFNSPEFANTNNKFVSYSKNFINSFEDAIQQPNFHASYNGKVTSAYDLFDFDTLIKYWMIEELFMNQDGMKKSTYFHKAQDKDGEISKMQMGPVWDMDWSSHGCGETSVYDVWQTEQYYDKAQAKQWYKYIVKDPYFLTRAQEFYWEHRHEMVDMINSIYGEVETEIFHDEAYEYLLDSAKANNERWKPHHRKFEDEAELLYTWLNNRLDWLDGKMTSVEEMGFYTPNNNVQLAYADGKLKVNAPGVKADVLVNGELLGKINLIDGTGKLDIDPLLLTEKRDVIYVVVYDRLQRAVGTNYCYDQQLPKGEVIGYKMISKPEKAVYGVDEELDFKGLQVAELYNNGYKEIIPNMDITFTGFEKGKIGKQTITLTYNDWKSTFDVVVGTSFEGFKNEYVTIGADVTTGTKPLKLEIWESGTGAPLYEETIENAFEGDFTKINFSAIAANGWKVKLAKYRSVDNDGKGFESEPVDINKTNATFNFEGFTENIDNIHTLIIDIVKVDEELIETRLEDSFNAEDCGILTSDASGTGNKLGFIVNKGNERVFTSLRPFTYNGSFNSLTFNYVAPEGYEVDSIEAVLSNNEKVTGSYVDSVISFGETNVNEAEYMIINLKEKAKEPFTLSCKNTTVKVNTNAIVYLKSVEEIDPETIKLSENGVELSFSKAPVYDETTQSYKLYIKPTELGIHEYTITVGDFSQTIKIQGSRTALS